MSKDMQNNCPKHNSNIRCLVYHPDGICPGYPDNALCTCPSTHTGMDFGSKDFIGHTAWEIINWGLYKENLKNRIKVGSILIDDEKMTYKVLEVFSNSCVVEPLDNRGNFSAEIMSFEAMEHEGWYLPNK